METMIVLAARRAWAVIGSLVRKVPHTWLVIAALGVVIYVQHCSYQAKATTWAHDRRSLELSMDSVAATLDTTRQTLAGAERRILQVALTNDSLSTALHREQKVNAQLVLTVASLKQVAHAPVRVDTVHDTRMATFQLDSAPIHVTTDVTLPPPPADGLARFTVRLDPIRLNARIGCSTAHGLRSATLLVQADGVIVHIPHVQQDPSICNPIVSPVARHHWYDWVVPVGSFLAGIGIGHLWP